MAGIMLRSLASSLSTERAPLPFISDSLGCPAWSHPGTDASLASGGKTKHTPESHRASPYPPLARSSSGYGSAAGSKRLAASALASTRSAQSLRRTASLQGGDSLAALQAAADDAKCSPLIKQPRLHRTRTGSSLRPLRPTQTLVNLDVLVCPPPAPPPRCDVRLGLEFSASNHRLAHSTPRRPALITEPSITAIRRRSSLAPAETAPTAMVMRSSVALPSPPVTMMAKKKRESLAQRTLRRTFERTPRGAQVKVLGAHAAVRMMSAMQTEDEDEAAVAASVIVVGEDEPEDVCMADSWVELDKNNEPASSSPVLVESSQIKEEEMEWSVIDEDECRSGTAN